MREKPYRSRTAGETRAVWHLARTRVPVALLAVNAAIPVILFGVARLARLSRIRWGREQDPTRFERKLRVFVSRYAPLIRLPASRPH